MSDRLLLNNALVELQSNPEQLQAVQERGHCVVLAGPGSGKTKTLTIAMARAFLEDVEPPRGIACITYNNECSIELESRLAKLAVEPSERVFIGTVHGFALAHIISPYARCVLPELASNLAVATDTQRRAAVEVAHAEVIRDGGNPHSAWRFAEEKRKRDVDRTARSWRGRNPELADFIEAYEGELRRRGLIDFDDMPLLAFRMVQAHPWIKDALRARFPILFVDEYQDLGHALHELVIKLCFEAGIRLFAVGDADQSVYGFNGANPELLRSIAERPDVRVITLKFNYRCGTRIISASMAALGEERGYSAPDGAAEGTVSFIGVDGGLDQQAKAVMEKVIPAWLERGVPLDQIAVLYRSADHGNRLADAAAQAGYPIVRADREALVRRNSRLSRFVEACARWVVGGWKTADPPFRRLSHEATAIVLGPNADDGERRHLQIELMEFLRSSLDEVHSANSWLRKFQVDLIAPWKAKTKALTDDWDVVEQMIARTDPATGEDMSLEYFSGRIEGSGRLNLSTLHSAKGREFDAVVLFAMNNDVIPSQNDLRRREATLEARRLFYVGVTRSRHDLTLVFRKKQHSPWVKELYDRTKG